MCDWFLLAWKKYRVIEKESGLKCNAYLSICCSLGFGSGVCMQTVLTTEADDQELRAEWSIGLTRWARCIARVRILWNRWSAITCKGLDWDMGQMKSELSTEVALIDDGVEVNRTRSSNVGNRRKRESVQWKRNSIRRDSSVVVTALLLNDDDESETEAKVVMTSDILGLRSKSVVIISNQLISMNLFGINTNER